MSSFRERPEFLRGRAGEQRVATWLQGRGWYVIPSYDYSGESGDKAPRLIGADEAFPLPDLDIAKGGQRRWAEVKTKYAATFTRKTQTYDHGINYRHFEAYLRVQEETGSECWIMIYEESTGCLIGRPLSELGLPRRATSLGIPMAYWPRTSFRALHVFAEGAA